MRIKSRCGASSRSWTTGRETGRGAGPAVAVRIVALLSSLAPLLGCVHGLEAAAPAPPDPPWQIPAAELATQRLFRVRYDGPEGDGSLKLTLRLAAVERFQLAAADALGRPLWSLTYRGGEVDILDHRQRSYCTGRDVPPVPEPVLEELPLAALPRVLLGRLPSPPVAGAAAAGGGRDYRDAAGRRWTSTEGESGPRSWTLWQAGEPLVWWQEQDRGGILSHREGIQFRWRQTVSEPLAGDLPAIAVPDGYSRQACGDWRVPSSEAPPSPAA